MTREMKYSGVEWIGNIPSEWKVEKNKHCFELTKNIVGEEFENYKLLSLTKKGIVIKDENNSFGKVPDSYETYQSVKQGQLVLCLFDLDCSAVFSGLSNYDGMISPAYKIYNCKECIDKKYAEYWFDYCFDGRKYMIYSKSLRYVVNADDFGTIEIAIPPLSEQKKIADFLDGKVAEIDKIIAETKSSIVNYKEYKQSVITEAVTKGLDKNVPMKDSGIEWIGDIPSGWNVSKIKYISIFSPSCDITGLTEESEVTYTPMEYVKNGYYINNVITLKRLASSLTAFQDGDIVMAKVTPCFENGNIAIMENMTSGIGFGTSELFVFRPTNIDKKYMFYWLRNTYFIKRAISTMTGAGGLKRVSTYFVKNENILLPSHVEQKQITEYIDEKCTEIDNIITEKEKLISYLEEYKKSLIYEYVTGKRTVE